MINTNKIKGRMRELGKTQSDCAEYIGVKPPTFNQKINNIRPFYLTEAEKLSEFLEIQNSNFSEYFFCHQVA